MFFSFLKLQDVVPLYLSLDDIELSISLRLQLLMAFSTAARRNILFISTKPHSTALALYRSYSTVVIFLYKKLIYKL